MYDEFFRWYDAGDMGKRARVFAKIISLSRKTRPCIVY